MLTALALAAAGSALLTLRLLRRVEWLEAEAAFWSSRAKALEESLDCLSPRLPPYCTAGYDRRHEANGPALTVIVRG